MESNYYTPDLEDIHVGYECEVHIHSYGFGYMWEPYVYPSRGTLPLSLKAMRTPYLTKEQIEKEGWENKTHSLNIGSWAFEKGNRFVVIRMNDLKNPLVLDMIVKDPSIEELVLGMPSEHFRLTIPCPSINEFRKICKLLGI